MSEVRERARNDLRADAPAPGTDLERLRDGLNALVHRTTVTASRLDSLYGQGQGISKDKPEPAGIIPQLQQLLDDLSDEFGRVENLVNRL